MIYLLDTNVVSETISPKPNPTVIDWLDSLDPMHCALSVITLGEIRRGIQKIEVGKRKLRLLHWLELTLPELSPNILPVDIEVAEKWGYITGKTNVPSIDGLIAATALAHNLKLVTRNTKDFCVVPGIEIFNPWEL